eukprot:scaffold5479_cov199-Amphora_coffeaeformis.AAC.17
MTAILRGMSDGLACARHDNGAESIPYYQHGAAKPRENLPLRTPTWRIPFFGETNGKSSPKDVTPRMRRQQEKRSELWPIQYEKIRSFGAKDCADVSHSGTRKLPFGEYYAGNLPKTVMHQIYCQFCLAVQLRYDNI